MKSNTPGAIRSGIRVVFTTAAIPNDRKHPVKRRTESGLQTGSEDQLAYNKRRTVVGPGHDVGTGADDELRVQPAMSRPAAGVSGSE